MEALNELFSNIAQYIDIPYLLTFMLISYMVNNNFVFKIKTVFLVAIIALIVAIPYYFVVKIELSQLIFSYTLGTSLHELFFKWIENKFK